MSPRANAGNVRPGDLVTFLPTRFTSDALWASSVFNDYRKVGFMRPNEVLIVIAFSDNGGPRDPDVLVLALDRLGWTHHYNLRRVFAPSE